MLVRIVCLLFLGIFVFSPLIAQHNVKDFGARGDGRTLDTEKIQSAIDKANALGGGVVEVPTGTYKIGTLILKDNVTLNLHAGSILLGSPNYSDYTAVNQKFESRTNTLYAKYFMIFAERAKNISITGSGTIHGNGSENFQNTYPQNLRPFMIRLVDCDNVTIQDVHLMESANWTLHLLGCRDVNIQGIAIENSGEGNRDGLDIDACQRVTVSNSRFKTTDDAIVLKSSTNLECRDIAITNCVLRTRASAIKTGTESNGDFRNIAISNCVVKDASVHAGIELMTVDGGAMERIFLDNIVMENVGTPIFIKLGVRARPYKNDQYVSGIGRVADISLNNISVTDAKLPSSIMGLRGQRISNVSISNYTVRYSWTQEAVQYNQVPFEEFAYPMALMYEKLPAYGLYCRNVEGLHLQNVSMYSVENEKRPAMTFDQVDGLEIIGVKGNVKTRGTPMVHFRNVRNAFVNACRSLDVNDALFEAEQESCVNLNFSGNVLQAGQREVNYMKALDDRSVFDDFKTEMKYSVAKEREIDGLPAHDLAVAPLRTRLKIVGEGWPQLCLLMLNDGARPEKVLLKYRGITQEFVISWNKWGWAPISLPGDFKRGEEIDFEVVAEDRESYLKIAKVYLRYQDTIKTD